MKMGRFLIALAIFATAAFSPQQPSPGAHSPDALTTPRRALTKPAQSHLQTRLFGVINDQGEHYADEWAHGVRATTFEFHWNYYEPAEGVYDQDYINHMQGILGDLKAQGWYVQLVPGIQYTPDWVFENYPQAYYVNQYGERYDPDPQALHDFRVINAPFNSQARDLITGYLARIFQDFPASDFDSVRIGGGPQGELRYPPAEWNGYANSYWAFDASAQNPAVSGIPAEVVGWRPGIDPNPGTTGRGQLIVNPGFEDTHPWFPLLGWTPDEEVIARVSVADPYGGEQALELAIASQHRVHQFVRVEPGTTYDFGGWIRSLDGAGSGRIFFTQWDENTEPVADAPFGKLESQATVWTDLAASLTTTSETRYLKVELDGSQAGTYFFDDLWLKHAGEDDERDRDIAVPVAFYDWYVQQLTDYQNWQIAELRKHFAGQLDVLYAGKGLMPDHLNDALTNDLRGDGWSEDTSALYSATPFDRHVVGLSTTEAIALYTTGIELPAADEVDDASPYPGDWSAARWIAHLAREAGLPIWGENRGANTAAEMDVAFERIAANYYTGLMWGFESEVYADPGLGYANIDDYAARIAAYGNTYMIYLPKMNTP